MTRLLAVLAAALVAVSPAVPVQAPPPPVHDGDLDKGISLARDGDFEGALVELDAAVRALREDPVRRPDLVRGLVYLGVAYLELNQESSARGRFREVVELDPALELSPREFSPQVRRVFGAVRADAGLSPAPEPSPSPRAAAVPPRRVAPSPSPSPGKKRGAGLWIVGGGVAAAGTAVALAAGGGGGGGAEPTTTTTPTGGVTTTTTPAVTTTTTTLPGTSPTTTSTTTTMAPAPTTPPAPTTTQPEACTYTLEPEDTAIPLTGGEGECNVRASDSDCRFTFQKSGDQGGAWIEFESSTTGQGNDRMRYSVGLSLVPRNGAITIAEGGGRCTIRQALLAGAPAAAGVRLSSHLAAPGATGQVILDGTSMAVQEQGLLARALPRGAAVRRVEAVVVEAGGRGTWTFSLDGALAPGSLRVIAGRVLRVGGTEVTFALSGRPGERIVFTFLTAE